MVRAVTLHSDIDITPRKYWCVAGQNYVSGSIPFTFLSLMYISYCISFPFLISLPHSNLQVTLISLTALLYPVFSSDMLRIRCNSSRYRKVFSLCGKVVKERESTVKFSFTNLVVVHTLILLYCTVYATLKVILLKRTRWERSSNKLLEV